MVQLTLERQGRSEKDQDRQDRCSIPHEVEVLEDLIVAAFNDAAPKVDGPCRTGDAEADRRPATAGGMKLPF